MNIVRVVGSSFLASVYEQWTMSIKKLLYERSNHDEYLYKLWNRRLYINGA